MFIGYYNKSIILTFIGLFFSIFGINFCLNGDIEIALILMIISGICDCFDGYVASLVKRNDKEKLYGVELDSLVDTVCFGVFPIIVGIALGYNKIYNICKKVLSKLTKINININFLSIVFLIVFAIIFFDINEIYIKCIILTLVLMYILKNKDNAFFTVSVISFIFIFIIRKYGAKSVAYEGFTLWCSGSVFYITSKVIKKDRLICFLKYIHFINLFNCLIAMLSEKNAFYGKIVLYLLPFSLTYLVLEYKKTKKPTVINYCRRFLCN